MHAMPASCVALDAAAWSDAWKPTELETIARVFRVSVDELTGALELV